MVRCVIWFFYYLPMTCIIMNNISEFMLTVTTYGNITISLDTCGGSFSAMRRIKYCWKCYCLKSFQYSINL